MSSTPLFTPATATLLVMPLLSAAAPKATLSPERSPATNHMPTPAHYAAADSVNWNAVDRALGRSGKMQPGEVYKYSMPRRDLRVTVGGVAIKPALALGSWLAFKQGNGESIAMGDLVLTTSEIRPVLSKLQELGVEQTALHNHLLHESPAVMYLHIHARGDPVKIAGAVRQALALTRTPPERPGESKATPPLGMDTTAVARALGHGGKVNGGVYQVSVPRTDETRDEGMVIPPAMGVATAINFQPTKGGKAISTGDFVMTGPEVNPVLQELSAAGIEVTALHNHLLTEKPRLFFAHFWGAGDAVQLARGLRSALDKMSVRHQSL